MRLAAVLATAALLPLVGGCVIYSNEGGERKVNINSASQAAAQTEALEAVRKVDFDVALFADLHEALVAVLVIDSAGHPDRLVCRAEMRVAADLHRDLAPQAA